MTPSPEKSQEWWASYLYEGNQGAKFAWECDIPKIIAESSKRARLEAIERMEGMINQPSDAGALGSHAYASAYNKALSDILSRFAAYKKELE